MPWRTFLDSNKFVFIVLSVFSLTKKIHPRVWRKPLSKDAKILLPVDVCRSKTPLLNITLLYSVYSPSSYVKNKGKLSVSSAWWPLNRSDKNRTTLAQDAQKVLRSLNGVGHFLLKLRFHHNFSYNYFATLITDRLMEVQLYVLLKTLLLGISPKNAF